jgi:molybdenum cofactor cytidylyltransferase
VTNEPRKPTVAAILLAAGESSRMGEIKALLPWIGGVPMIEYQVRALDEAGYDPIVVVLGHEPYVVAKAIPEEVDVSVVVNDRWEKGRSESIVVGVLQVATPETDGLLIASVDQPRSPAMLRALREAWEAERPYIATPSLEGKAGHPSIFDGGLMTEILQVTEDTEGLRQVMRNFAEERLFVNVDDPLALTNLNTREDYEAALKLAEA